MVAGKAAPSGEYDHVVKLLLLGDSAVGKTSMLNRFCENRFETNFVLTIGVDFKSKQVTRNDRRLKFQVWDTAGQERFRTITPAYYRSAMGVVICYDICDEASFVHIEYWLDELQKHGDASVQRILVGNKADLGEQRQVPTEGGLALAEKHNMKFFETSAKTGDNVENAFLSMADLVVEHRYANAASGRGNERSGMELRRVDNKKKEKCKC